mgnify:CR=1 FL=1
MLTNLWQTIDKNSQLKQKLLLQQLELKLILKITRKHVVAKNVALATTVVLVHVKAVVMEAIVLVTAMAHPPPTQLQQPQE